MSAVTPLAVCVAGFTFHHYGLLPWFGVTGAVVTLAFAAGAYFLGAVNASGAVAGCAAALALYWFAGPAAFVALVTVFVLTAVSTRLGYGRKHRLGRAESRRGRSAGQVLANLTVASLCAIVLPLVADSLRARLLVTVAMAAALAEAAADTVSSECGIAWTDRVWLITDWKPVSAGTDGGLSLPGSLAGAAAAAVVASVCAAFRIMPLSAIPVAAGAAVGGMLFDSVLGATLERRGVIGNNAVNFLGTAFAALVALVIAANL